MGTTTTTNTYYYYKPLVEHFCLRHYAIYFNAWPHLILIESQLGGYYFYAN